MPLGMEVRLGPHDFVLDGDAAPLSNKGAEPPQFSAHGWMDEDGTWHRAGPRFRTHCARWGPSYPLQKGGRAPSQFSAHFYCGQATGCTKMPLGMEVGLSLGDFVLNGDPVPLPKKGAELQFSAHVHCGQTDGWIKITLRTEVGLGPADIVLDRDPASPPPPKKKAQPPNFRSMSIMAKRRIRIPLGTE